MNSRNRYRSCLPFALAFAWTGIASAQFSEAVPPPTVSAPGAAATEDLLEGGKLVTSVQAGVLYSDNFFNQRDNKRAHDHWTD